MKFRMLMAAGLLAAMLGGMAAANQLPPQVADLVQNLQKYRRTVLAYLRTENSDLALIEIERLETTWTADLERARVAIGQDRSLAEAVTETARAIRAARVAGERGDFAAARSLIEAVNKPIGQWRRRQGIRSLSDCIGEAGEVYERLDVHRTSAPDLMREDIRTGIAAQAETAARAFRRCNEEADATTRANVEFRRLIDGMINSLAQVPEALLRRDAAYLHRLLIEQRSFERLLSMRFG